MTTVVLIGTLDTKGEEYRWIHDQLVALGCGVTSVDVGTFSDAAGPGDISSSEVAAAAGEDLDALPDARILEPCLVPQWTRTARSRPMAASPRIMPRLNGLQEAGDSSPTSSTSQRHNWSAT
jgi:hypothetical protein